MSVRLTLASGEQRALADSVAAVLTVDPDGGHRKWAPAVTAAARVLLGADYTLLAENAGAGFDLHSDDMPATALTVLRQFTYVEAGRMVAADPTVRATLQPGRMEPWSSDLLDMLSGGAFRRTPVYEALWTPLAMGAGVGVMSESAGHGVHFCATYRTRRRRNMDRPFSLAALLVPAFRAAAAARARLHAVGGLPPWADVLGEGVVLFDADGREAHRNTAAAQLLAADPARDTLSAALRTAACSALAVARAGARAAHVSASGVLEAVQAAPSSGTVRTANAHYALDAGLVAGGAPPGVFVILRRLGPCGPPAPDRRAMAAVVAQYRLTARESAVAELLARHASNDDVAAALGISAHTARHHTEHVLAKLGVHSRRAVLGRLSALG